MATEIEGSCIGKGSSERKYVKILILGEVGIGKTTLIKWYFAANNISVQQLDIEELNIFAMYPLRMKYKGNVVDVRLLDMDPGANSPERRQSYPEDVNVILLCFSIGHYSTLKSVYNLWIHEVRAHFGKLIPILLVGLRSDMRFVKPSTLGYSILLCEENRVVEKSEAEIIHKNYYFQGDYMECSMYDKDSVIRVIHKTIFVALED